MQVAKTLRRNLQYFRGSASEGATLYHVHLHRRIRFAKIMTPIASAIVRNGLIAFTPYMLFIQYLLFAAIFRKASYDVNGSCQGCDGSSEI